MAGENAVRQQNRIQAAIESLDEMPLRNRVYGREPWKTRNLHIMPADNYLVFYLTETEMLKVTKLRIMYGGRDITNIFKGKQNSVANLNIKTSKLGGGENILYILPYVLSMVAD